MKKSDNFDAAKWLVENKLTNQSKSNEEYVNDQGKLEDFDPYHAQLDYETNIVDVQYYGKLNEKEAIKYAKQSYNNIEGIIVYNSPPNNIGGYENLGVVGIK
jgi:hypothetical protein